MVLSQNDVDAVVKFVKTEPKTMQEISKLLKKSWVTTDSYVSQIKERTGLIGIKTFRGGTQGAIKVVYYNHHESLQGEDLQSELFSQIKISKDKNDFDFFEIFQFIDDNKKKAHYAKNSTDGLSLMLGKANNVVYCFSGNLSFLNKDAKILDVIEDMIKRKVRIKILCRIDLATVGNISKLSSLIAKYPEFIEIRHCIMPLRGFIIDDTFARFKSEIKSSKFKSNELTEDKIIFYEISDALWIGWLSKVFWNLFRSSIDYSQRLKQFDKFL